MNNHIPKKKYGQNFLKSTKLLERIKEVVNLDKTKSVLEIGPGTGYLTSMLVENAKDVTSYEIDDDLIPQLVKKFKIYSNFKLVHQDFMKAKIEGNNLIIVANIPYYITTPIVEKLIENRSKIDKIYIMVQKEVAQRLCTNFSSSNVSTLTHYIRYYAEPEYLFTVEKEYFYPVPKVDSAFIKLKFRKDKKYENMIDENIYFSFIKKAFFQKRKTLLNNLKNSGIDKKKLENILKDTKLRAEELSIEEFVELIKELEYDRLWVYN